MYATWETSQKLNSIITYANQVILEARFENAHQYHRIMIACKDAYYNLMYLYLK